MKVIGIVAEYNPFHNGHLYQLEKSKKELAAEYAVAVMSGNFVMRGECALYDKFSRAKAATECGVDLVIELPVPYALSSAEYFAKGAVSILDSLNVVDYLSFGSENGKTDELFEIAKVLSDNKTVEKIKENLKKGIPVFEAYSELFSDNLKEILKMPNNILGINYIKALNELKSNIELYTVKRINTGYNDALPNGNFASATAMRELVKDEKEIRPYIPDCAYNLLKDKKPVFEEDFNQSMVYSLRIKDKEDYLKYADVTEGLNNLIKQAANENSSIEDIAMAIKSKRYSYTRIKRILYNIFLDIPSYMREKKPEYARVLAFNEKGQKLLSIIREKSDIPVFTNIKREMFDKYEMLDVDIRAGRIYSLAHGKNSYYEERIILKNK